MVSFLLTLLLSATSAIAAVCPTAVGCGCEKVNVKSLRSRFPVDWSYAGYNNGNDRAFPKGLPVLADLKRDFGARGDGHTDDTSALERAGKRIFNKIGYISVPAGKYIITRPVRLKTDAMFRGAGRDRTVFYFPKPLRDVLGSKQYAYGPFYITIDSSFPFTKDYKIADVLTPIPRGTRTICVKSLDKIKVGNNGYLIYTDPTGGLDIQKELNGHAHINMGRQPDYSSSLKFYVSITSVDRARKCITINRPTPMTIPAKWTARIHNAGRTWQGVSDMAFAFPPTAYQGHFKETGKNVLMLSGFGDTWMRNLEFRNVDFGMYILSMHGSTISDVFFYSDNAPDKDPSSYGSQGHYGIAVWGGSYNHFSHIHVNCRTLRSDTTPNAAGLGCGM